jgi:hypothetical protein
MMTTALFSLLAVPLLATPFDEAAGIELRYTGALSKAGRNADETAVKRFNLYCVVIRELDGGRRIAFHLNERGGGGWAWPERFGAIAIDRQLQPVATGGIRLLYEYEGNPLVIPLPLPVVAYAATLKEGAKWVEGKETWEVVRAQKVQDRKCWQVQVSTAFGRKRTLAIDTEAPLVVALEERVFVGQGDEHALTMHLDSMKPLDADQLARDTFPSPLCSSCKAACSEAKTNRVRS